MSSVHRRAEGTYVVSLSTDDAVYTVEKILGELLDRGIVETHELPFDWRYSHTDAEGRRYPYL
ncbi:MAG: hypothetical protein ACREBU_09345 [Nitrososphaera sp.]